MWAWDACEKAYIFVNESFLIDNTFILSLRKQPTFGDATTGLPAKWRLRNESRNSILMTRHYPDLGRASDWSCRVWNMIQPIRSTTQIWVVTRHQCGISALVSKTSFGGETTGSVAKCGLFSQAISYSPFCILCTAAPSPKTKSQWRGGCTGLPFC